MSKSQEEKVAKFLELANELNFRAFSSKKGKRGAVCIFDIGDQSHFLRRKREGDTYSWAEGDKLNPAKATAPAPAVLPAGITPEMLAQLATLMTNQPAPQA